MTAAPHQHARFIAFACVGIVSGCDTVFSSRLAPDAPVDSVPADARPLVDYCFTEDFSTGLEPSRWKVSDQLTAETTVAVMNQALEVTLAPDRSAASYNGIESLMTFDLRDAALEVRLLQAPAMFGVEAYVALAAGEQFYMVDIAEGMLSGMVKEAGRELDIEAIPFDPMRHEYLQIIHQRDLDQIQFRASVDARTWLPIRAPIGIRVPLEALTVTMGAGTYQSVTMPGVVTYDAVRVARTSCPR